MSLPFYLFWQPLHPLKESQYQFQSNGEWVGREHLFWRPQKKPSFPLGSVVTISRGPISIYSHKTISPPFLSLAPLVLFSVPFPDSLPHTALILPKPFLLSLSPSHALRNSRSMLSKLLSASNYLNIPCTSGLMKPGSSLRTPLLATLTLFLSQG